MKAVDILILDCEDNTLNDLKRLSESNSWHVSAASDPAKAIGLLRTCKIKVIIADQNVFSTSGIQFLKEALALSPHSIAILLAGRNTAETTAALSEGLIFSVLKKPYEDNELLAGIVQALRQYQLKEELGALREKVETTQKEQKTFLRDLSRELQNFLTAIQTGVMMMVRRQNGELNPDQAEALQKLRAVIRKLEEFITDRLSPSGFAEGKILPELHPAAAEEDQKTILVIDDEENIVDFTRMRLIHQGHHVMTALDGVEGLERLKEHTPDLIILDVNMPRMNGIDFFRKITDKKGKPAYPVLVLTSREELEDVFREADAAGFLPKPFEFDDLLREVKRIFSEQKKTER